MSLDPYGWNAQLEETWQSLGEPDLAPARVLAQHRGAYVVRTAEEERDAEVAGRLQRSATRGGLPVTGDWVALRLPPAEGTALVEHVLPRRTAFVRKAAGEADVEQVIAANLDVAFLVGALPELNPRRLERFLAAAWESGADPVVVLTKRDLAEDVEGPVLETEGVSLGVPVRAISSVTGEGVDELRDYLRPNRTAALLGVSGAGKSSLVNHLLGRDRQAVAEVRSDGRGRHTTSHRELFLVPGGGLVLDTPGIRELALWEADEGLADAFGDVAELAARCRFADCRHETEPGCAVRAAIEAGTLAPERLESHRKLLRELEHLERRRDPRLQAEQRREWRRIHRDMRRSR